MSLNDLVEQFLLIYGSPGVPQLGAILLFFSGVLGALFKSWGLTKKMIGALFMFSFSQGLVGEAMRFAYLVHAGIPASPRPLILAFLVVLFSFTGLIVGYHVTGRGKVIASPSELRELEVQVAHLTELVLRGNKDAAATEDH